MREMLLAVCYCRPQDVNDGMTLACRLCQCLSEILPHFHCPVHSVMLTNCVFYQCSLTVFFTHLSLLVISDELILIITVKSDLFALADLLLLSSYFMKSLLVSGMNYLKAQWGLTGLL